MRILLVAALLTACADPGLTRWDVAVALSAAYCDHHPEVDEHQMVSGFCTSRRTCSAELDVVAEAAFEACLRDVEDTGRLSAQCFRLFQ